MQFSYPFPDAIAELQQAGIRAMFENTLDGMALVDDAGNFLEVNQLTCTLFGLSRADLLHCSITSLMVSGEDTFQRFLQTAPRGNCQRSEMQIRNRAGQIRQVQYAATARVDSHAHLLVLRDITPAASSPLPVDDAQAPAASLEFQLAEDVLRLSEHRYQAVVNSQQEMICRFLPDLTLTFVNTAYCRCFGKSVEELMGENFLNLVPAEARDLVWQQVAELRTLTSAHPTITHEHTVVLANGEIGWQEWSNTGIFDDQGQLVEIQAVGRDIRDRKRAETALHQSDATNQAIIDALPDLVKLVHRDGTYLKIHTSTNLRLFHADQMQVGNNMYDLLPPVMAQQRQEYIDRALSTGTLQIYEYRLPLQDEQRYEEARIMPMTDDTVLLMVRDITRRKLGEQERQRIRAELQRSKERYQRLFNSGNDAIFVHRITTDGDLSYFTEVNDLACYLLGYHREELLRLSLLDLNAEDIAGRVPGIIAQLLQEHRALFEMVVKTKQGDRIPVEINSRLFDLEGDRMVISIMRDLRDRQRIEQTLRDQEAQLRNIFEQSAVGIAYGDQDGHLLKVNPTFCDLTGYTASELLQRSYADLTHPDDLLREVELSQLLLNREIPSYTLEKRYLKKSGSLIWVNVTVSAIWDEAGNLKHGIAVVQDISDRKQAETALRLSERLFISAFNDAPIGMALVSLDQRILNVNQALCEMLGYSEAELLTKTVPDITHPDYRDSESAYKQALETGQRDSFQMEKVYLHADGHLVWGKLSVSLIRDSAGNHFYYVGHLEDVTERKQAEAALKQSEVWFRTTFEQSVVGIGHVDPDGHIIWVNQKLCEMTGYSPQEFREMTYIDLTHPADRAQEAEQVRSLTVGEISGYTLEKRYICKDGSHLWVNVSVSAIRDDEGNLQWYVGVIQDVSDRKQAEAALAEERQLFIGGPTIVLKWVPAEGWPVAYVSPNVRDQLGYEAEQLMQNQVHFADLIHPDDVQRVAAEVLRYIQSETICFEQEYRLCHANGSYRWFYDFTVIVRQDNDELAYFYGYLQDISDRKQSELALQESETRYRSLVQNMPGAVYRCQPYEPWKATFLSDGIERIVGYPSSDIEQDRVHSWLSLIHPDDRPMVNRGVAEALAQKRPYILEYRMMHRDGQIRWVYEQGQGFWDEQGNLLHLDGVLYDITERKRAQNALQISEERLRLALDSAHMGCWDLNLLTQEIVWTESLEILMGMAPGSFDGRFETFRDLVHPEDCDRVLAAVQRSVEYDEDYDIEFRFVKPDGQIRWAASLGNVIRDETGRPVRMTGVDVDITDRKLAEEALSIQKAQYQMAVKAGQVGVWNWDLATNEIYLDPQLKTMLGYQDHEIRNHLDDWGQYVHPEDAPAVMQAAQAHLAGETSEFLIEHRMRHRDGTVRWVLARGVVVRSPDGEPTRMIGTDTDITERKQREETLRRYERIVSATPDAVALLDCHYTYLVVNQTYTVWFGKSREEIIGHSVAELLGEAVFLEKVKSRMDRAMTGEICHYQEWLELPQMGEQFIGANYAPYYEADGRITGIVVAARNLTNLKRAEQALQRQAEQEFLISSITNRMRRSLNLPTILTTTVMEVRRTLKVDRVLIYQLDSPQSGTVVAESVAEHWNSLLGLEITDPCLQADTCIIPYLQGKVHNIADVQMAHRLSDCYRDMLTHHQVRANLVVPILRGDGEIWGFLAAQNCAEPHHWDYEEVDLLKQLASQLAIAIQQSLLYEQTVAQAQRELVLRDIVTAIRNSLDLDEILQQTADQLLHSLAVNRCVVALGAETDEFLTTLTVATTPTFNDWQDRPVNVCDNPHVRAVFQKETPSAIDDVTQEPLLDGMSEVLQALQIRSMLTVAIRLEGTVKGIICVQQCDHYRHWTNSEQILIQQVADQLAIAIQQSDLYHQVQSLNTNLEGQVQERTAQLRQSLDFEALLKRITDNVRDSLNEQQILETAVSELAEGLGTLTCDTGLYNLKAKTSTVYCEYVRGNLPSSRGKVIAMSTYPELYAQLLRGENLHFCRLSNTTNLRDLQEGVLMLACPIISDQDILGDIWLYRPIGEVFTNQEVHLVQQVANQCAIALRQSRLYQAAQQQVVELERLNKLKDDFLSTVSHELRTPMASIQMATQMLEIQLTDLGLLTTDSIDQFQDNQAASPLDRYFQILKDECQREIRLINNLLDLTRVDSDTEPLMSVDIQLYPWVDHISEPFAERMADHNQDFQLDIPEDLYLETDLSYLERILIELFSNACKYSPEGATITVSAGITDQTVQITVSNTGTSIVAVECDRIFDKFYRIPNNDPWKYGGTGLGLALVKHMVEKLNGTIRAESSNNEVRLILNFPRYSQHTSPEVAIDPG
jgi:PAS domain S-box-containing protein